DDAGRPLPRAVDECRHAHGSGHIEEGGCGREVGLPWLVEVGVIASVTAAQSRTLAAAGFGLFAGRVPLRDRPTAYLCRDFVCRVPVTDPAELTIRETSGEISPDGPASP
ncbi:hypothetical protein QN345_15730, partial [Cryobacterium sp. 10I1]|nr:hypothetical protein [Cryobacterium sp. 10I1]